MSREAGNVAEQQAVDYLQTRGVRIIARNFLCRHGEIDLIGQDGVMLLFIEVRMRQRLRDAIVSVDEHKQKKLRKTAGYYLSRHAPDALCRFDVVVVDHDNRIHWIQEAF